MYRIVKRIVWMTIIIVNFSIIFNIKFRYADSEVLGAESEFLCAIMFLCVHVLSFYPLLPFNLVSP